MKYSLISCLFLLLISLTNCTEDEFLSTSYLPTDVELETFSTSNPKVPILNKVTFEGSKVTLNFTNPASPKKPEGGFELMLNGKRTAISITPRIHSTEKNLTMSFTLDNPQNYYYQIYARWNSGYLSSEKFYPGQANTPSAPSEDPSDDIGSGDSDIPGLPSLKLIKGYEFEDNIGRNVTWEKDGLIVHHLGRKDGKVVTEDGKGAYHFRITPGSYTKSDGSYRHQVIPRNLPSSYFTKGFQSKWDQEYIYEMKVKLSENYEIGTEYVALLGAKNDFNRRRNASFTLYTEGDHYLIHHEYSRKETTSIKGEGSKKFSYDANGNKLRPGIDYKESKKMGMGYAKINQDLGKWVTWTFHIKWAYNDNGFIKVYKNGKLFHTYYGPNSYKDDYAPYVLFGLYNSWWKNGQRTGSNVQETFVDHFRVYVPK